MKEKFTLKKNQSKIQHIENPNITKSTNFKFNQTFPSIVKSCDNPGARTNTTKSNRYFNSFRFKIVRTQISIL